MSNRRPDATDGRILRLLVRNARASYREIGVAVGLSANAVTQRMRRMEVAGIIRGYTTLLDPALDGILRGMGTDTLIVTGGETDVCVLATALGAVDRGFRLVMVADALCSSSDRTHDDLMEVYLRRFSVQIEIADAAQVREGWGRE